MKLHKTIICCLIGGWSGLASAGQGDISLAMKGGTLGVGGEIGIGLSDDVVLRAGVNYLEFSFDSTIADVDYTMEPEFKNGSLLLDYHPFGGGFRVTGGLYLNSNEVHVDGMYRKDLIPPEYQKYSIATELAHLKGTVEFNPIAPYAGIGWSSSRSREGWGISFDLGVLFHGDPDVTDLHVESSFDLDAYPEVGQFIDKQKKAIEEDLESFRYYPVASLMIHYRF